MDLKKIASRVAAEKPIEIRLQELLDEAESTGKPVSIEAKYGRFKEFPSNVRRIDASPDGNLEFFDKGGNSLGKFTMQQLFAEYE